MNITKLIAKFVKSGISSLTDEEKADLEVNKNLLSPEQVKSYEKQIDDEDKEDDDEETDETDEDETDEEADGIDEKALKSMISKSVQDEIAKKVDTISSDIVGKFMSGVKLQRKKAIDTGKKADDANRNTTREFMKALMNGDKARCKALTTSTEGESPDDAGAGLLIPEELRAEVLRIAETQYGLARRSMMYLPFSGPGNTRKIPALGTSVSVFWTNEAANKKSTQPKFSIVTQTLKKLAAIVPFTEEILEDSAINLTQLIATLFAEAVSKEEDLQFFAGTGTPWTGVLNNGQVNQVHQITGGIANLSADDLLNMQDATPSGALPGSKYYLNRTVLSVVRKLKDEVGQYVYQKPAEGLPATIWNYPYELSDAFPTASEVEEDTPYILFGNLKQGCIFGDKQQLRVKLLDQATITDADDQTGINLAEQDMVALRIVERVGYVVALPAALTVLVASEQESS